MPNEEHGPESPPDKPDQPSGDGSLIAVGVGASAGGLEAFTELLRHLPSSTGMSIMLVQHLDPHHESALPELLSSRTRMPVVQVQNDTAIQPDHVYVIPPNAAMRVRNRRLMLDARPTTIERFRPIDTFFNSLAEEFRFNAVGIVLSGTASDGTLGLKTIKAEGGITFAQNQTARFDSMPRSAIAAGVVDFILPPRRIAEELVAIADWGRHLNRTEGDFHEDATTLNRVLLLLRSNTGVDFTQYKQPTIRRRLNRRMAVRKAESLQQYFNLLKEDGAEAKALFDDLLINVTDFFRDPDVFEAAKKIAFPALIRDRKQPRLIRAWIPGCSSGEEVYSIAIALSEFFEAEDLDVNAQIFGTDVSDSAIDRARAGIFSDSAVAGVSPERLRRYFVRADSGYQISRNIREMCIFSRHDVARDTPLSRMDLISCRNLLIYFSPALQRRIVATFVYALQPGGCLILGPSETVGGMSDYFTGLDEKHKIYCRKGNALEAFANLTEGIEETEPKPAVPPAAPRPAEPLPSASGRLHNYVNQIVLSRFGPAGVVVNESLRMTEYRGEMAPYLHAAETHPDVDLMEVVRPELRASISTAIEQARRTGLAVVAETTAIQSAEGLRSVDVTVFPLSLPGMPQHFLILFGQAGEQEGAELTVPVESEGESAAAASLTAAEENAQLKQELRATREYLQSVIEELRSANEEAQSSNEELQSTMEEMQTSKEELQAANEELNTINSEMQSRNAELAQINDDLINLLASMNMPIVMTGIDLRIRRFTPMAQKALHLIPVDVGRPISDLKPRINVPNLEEILQRVLDTLQPHEQEVQDQEGKSYLMRIRPYRTTDNRIDGTVLQLLDVSDLKRSLEEVKHARDYAEAIVNTIREPLVVLNQDLEIQNANRAFFEILEVAPGTAVGRTIYVVGRGRFDLAKVRNMFEQLERGSAQLSDVEIEYQPERGDRRTLVLNVRRLWTPGQKHLILVAFEDITERKNAAEARYRRLFETARDGIVLVDAASGEILDLNPFTEHLLGYSRAELVGRKLWEIEVMRDVPQIQAAVEQVRDQGALKLEDLVLRTKEGREVQTAIIASTYLDGERRAIQFNIRDVSERKKFERELRETQKLESLGLMAGGIAHDFNNLLTGIIGNASLAYSESAPDAPQRRRLHEIIQTGERAAFLTRQMLAYAGRGRVLTEIIDLGGFVREISTLVRSSIPKTVELKLELAPDLPLIEADSAQIQQVIMNLVINAAEAIGENKPGRVEVRTSVRELDERAAAEFFHPEAPAPGTYVQLLVADNGSGMDEKTRSRIFDPFFTTKFAGRGLGLAAVQGIVRAHGGSIRVYSTPGHGSTFVLLFPASRKKAPAAGQHPPRIAIREGAVALVVDDEASIRKLSRDVLTRAGMKVLLADNGREAVELFRQHSGELSVVLLDLKMPVMGGDQVLPLLREINPKVPVILSSGFNEDEAAHQFAPLEPACFLQKPYTAERLLQAVSEIIKSKES